MRLASGFVVVLLVTGASALAAEFALASWFAAPAQVRTIARGAFVHADSETPPGPDAEWEPVALPDDWLRSRPGRSGMGWYRFDFEVERLPVGRQAIYLPKVNQNAAVWLNGEWIGQGGSFEAPVAQNWNRPLYYTFSPALLRAGHNRIAVRLYRLPDCFGELGRFELGPAALLGPRHARQFALQVSGPRATTILGCFVSVVMLAFWYASRDRSYAFFGIAVLLWSIATLNYHVRDLPMASRAWENLISISAAVVTTPLVLFVHDFRGLHRPRVERIAIGFALAAATVLALVPKPWFHPLFNVALVAMIAFGGYAFFEIVRGGLGQRATVRVAQLGGGVAVVAMAGHDVGIQLGALPTTQLALVPFAGLVAIGWYGAMLLLRFVHALERAENQNVELEQNIRDKRAELEQNFERMRELERVRVVAGERERVMREVHDGVGGQLVRTLALLESGDTPRDEAVGAVRDALDDMRLVVNSLDPLGEELPTLLGSLRGRLEPALVRRGVSFEWRAGDLPPTPHLGPDDLLHVVRIVQEAITNVHKHARATRVRVTTGARDSAEGVPGLFICVQDDGVGMERDPGARVGLGGGRGLDNMRHRARQIGAALRVSAGSAGSAGPAGPGTRVDLWIPTPSSR